MSDIPLDFQFVVFSPRDERLLGSNWATSAYQTAKIVWADAFKEIYGPSYKFTSDMYSKQSFIQALFMNGICVGMTAIRKIDLNNEMDVDDSWLENWSESDLERAREMSPTSSTWISSLYTVHPDFRRTHSKQEVPIITLLCSLQCLYMIESGHQSMLGMTRNNRSIDKASDFMGCTTIRKNIEQHGIASNAVMFEIENTIRAAKEFPRIAYKIFEERIDYSKTSEDHNEKAA